MLCVCDDHTTYIILLFIIYETSLSTCQMSQLNKSKVTYYLFVALEILMFIIEASVINKLCVGEGRLLVKGTFDIYLSLM